MSKEIVQRFKKSINESAFSSEQISIIWDFYVTKSVVASASQKRTARDYGLTKFPFDKMLEIADIQSGQHLILLANRMPDTLKQLDLCITGDKNAEPPIEIDKPRFACLMDYIISDNGPPKAKHGGKAETLLTHIRNSFAHGNTYFFNNGNVLLEDKNRGIQSAMILIKQKTLLDWIRLIDFEEKFYKIIETNDND